MEKFSKGLSKGGEKFVRRVKSITREQMEINVFRSDLELAISTIEKSCYRGDMPLRDRNLLSEYWKIRRDWLITGDEQQYKDASVDFNQKLDKIFGKKDDTIDLRLSAGLRIISSNFAIQPGR